MSKLVSQHTNQLQQLQVLCCWMYLSGLTLQTPLVPLVLQAFVKLESLPTLPKERREAYADLAMSIFQHHPPADPQTIAEAKEPSITSSTSSKTARRGGGGEADVVSDKAQVCGWRAASFFIPQPRAGSVRHFLLIARAVTSKCIGWCACNTGLLQVQVLCGSTLTAVGVNSSWWLSLLLPCLCGAAGVCCLWQGHPR